MPTFPLTLVKPYLKSKDYGYIYDETDKLYDPKRKNSPSRLRRGRIIYFLEEKDWLDDFINTHWSEGNTRAGISHMNTMKNYYDRVIFLSENSELINNPSVNNSVKKQKAILTKSKKPEQLLVKINEAFSKMLPIVVQFIGNTLKEKRNNWKKYATNNLSDITITNLHLEGSIEDFIMNLDILTSFHVIKNNWKTLFISKFPKNLRKDIFDYLYRLITIRNNIKAHDTMNVTEQYNKDRFDHDIGTMIFFIDHINKDIADKLRKMKNNY